MKSTNGRGAAAAARALATDHYDTFMLEEMMDKVPINLMRADTNFVILYLNAASKKTLSRIAHLLPCKVDEVVGSSIDIFHKNPAHQRKLLSDERNLPHRAQIHLEEEVLDLQMQAVHDEQGNYCGAMVTWDVVTEKLRLEAENKEYAEDNAALRKAMTFSVYGPDGTVLHTNENFEKLLGYNPGELVGKNNSIFADEATRQSAQYKETTARLLRGEMQQGEAKRITKDGREVWLQYSYNPVVDADGKVKKFLNYFVDITPQKLALNAMLADTATLCQAAVEGKLSTRADVSKHRGDFGKVVEGVNATLDAVIGPLNVAARYVDDIAKG